MNNISNFSRAVAHNITIKQICKYSWNDIIGKQIIKNDKPIGLLTSKIDLRNDTGILKYYNDKKNTEELKKIKLSEIFNWE